MFCQEIFWNKLYKQHCPEFLCPKHNLLSRNAYPYPCRNSHTAHWFLLPYLSKIIPFGEEAVGLYELISPVYALFFSLTCAGIQTAISRLTARCTAVGKSLQAVRCLMTGLIISCTLSILCMIFLQQTSPVIALHFLGDQRCAPLLYAMAYAFPFGAVHSSLCGYYLGQRRTNVPAFSQLLEQLARVSTVFLLCNFSLRQHFTPNIVFAVLGLAAGEMISSFYAVFYFLTEQRQQAELRPADPRNVSAL